MSANSLKMSNYLYGSLSLKISEKGLLIRGSLVQAHPEAPKKESCKSMIYGIFLFLSFQSCTQFAPNIVLTESSALIESSLGCKNGDVRYQLQSPIGSCGVRITNSLESFITFFTAAAMSLTHATCLTMSPSFNVHSIFFILCCKNP